MLIFKHSRKWLSTTKHRVDIHAITLSLFNDSYFIWDIIFTITDLILFVTVFVLISFSI